MQKEKIPENKMGTMALGPLLVSVSLPIVFSMFVSAMYNIVDSIYVAQIGEDALAAVSLVFPAQSLLPAVAVGTAVGMGSLVSRRLGERNPEAASRIAMNGIFLGVLSWVVFALGGIFLTGTYFKGYAAHPEVGPEIAAMGSTYMRIVLIASLGLIMSITLERILQSTGKSSLSMASQLTGTVVNIVLDPILIFGYLGLPAMGVAGAAWATVIGQFASMLVALFLVLRHNDEVRLKLKGFLPSWKTIKEIYRVGLPSILMQALGSVMVLAMNTILAGFGSTPISVFGVYHKLNSFVFMPVFGFNSGLIPILSYNYGAKKPARMEKALKLGLLICVGIMAVGTLLFWLIPDQLLMLFDAQPTMLEMGRDALRIISVGFPVAAVAIVLGGTFQALGYASYSMISSFVRQIVLLLPLAFVFGKLFGLPELWLCFPISEAVTFALTLFLFVKVWRTTVKPLYALKIQKKVPNV